ncbi:hypothetical protein HanIR_Chr16g0836181 [Helianthus annuus]|nr:hypothetical protein HanIR_Chr16g0836181 [Helianthus annuus]
MLRLNLGRLNSKKKKADVVAVPGSCLRWWLLPSFSAHYPHNFHQSPRNLVVLSNSVYACKQLTTVPHAPVIFGLLNLFFSPTYKFVVSSLQLI